MNGQAKELARPINEKIKSRLILHTYFIHSTIWFLFLLFLLLFLFFFLLFLSSLPMVQFRQNTLKSGQSIRRAKSNHLICCINLFHRLPNKLNEDVRQFIDLYFYKQSCFQTPKNINCTFY